MDEYYRTVKALPAWLAAPLAQLPAQTAVHIQELRLRTGCAVTFTVQGRQCSALALPGCPPALAAIQLDALQIEEIFYTLCNGSVHTHERELAEGYLTTAAGNRVGVAGQFVQREGQSITLQKITSLNLRIARSCIIPLPPALDKLLEKRSAVMESVLFGEITYEEGEKQLRQIETGRLYTKDISALREYEDTDLERIRKMDIVSIEKKSRIYDRMTFCIKIDWTIAGMDGVENITREYLAGVDVSNGDYRLISFEIRGE